MVPRGSSSKTGRWSLGVLFVALGCTPERRVNPPPEGEWLEWEPKSSEGEKTKVAEEPAAKPKSEKTAPPAGKSDEVEDLDQAPAKAKSSAPVVKCNGRDLTREVTCIALSELGANTCPEKLPRRPDAAEAGTFEQPPKGAKRDPSLEVSTKQCCYAWCGKVPSAAPPVPCKSPEPLFCFEAPGSSSHAAPPPFAECPMGLRKTAAKGRRKATPNATFSSKRTKTERSGEPRACCYEACK